MELLFDHSLGTGAFLLLLVSLAIACAFEFVNGFHDTANAVATVIYTRSLRPWAAVILSGICNFFGVFLGGLGVAMSIIYLLPVELLVERGHGAGLAMVLALLVAAILWNLGTWFLGLPASSSHTLIGAILGVGLANSILPGHSFGQGVNWSKAGEVGLSLLASPMLGFTLSYVLLRTLRWLVPNPELYKPADAHKSPPWWIRAILVGTCSGVSFAHGSNDGQKGVGLILLVLIGILPANFALNLAAPPAALQQARLGVEQAGQLLDAKAAVSHGAAGVRPQVSELAALLARRASLREVPKEERWNIRKDILLVDRELGRLLEDGQPQPERAAAIRQARQNLRVLTDYAPTWVLMAVALSLGIGTMIGWQRIVVTVGEKIGKTHLSYGQGASAELVAMSTIGLSAVAGLPVSTTHVLSSGIAGTMAAQNSGLQAGTVRKIASAWILTLPASMLMAGLLFPLFRMLLA